MTMAERNNKLKHLITCLKCEVRGKSCDVNCPTQYDAGNMGEIIENLEVISKALEQEPSGDVISRQAVIDVIKSMSNANPSYWNKCDVVDREDLIDEISELPSVKQEPKTGHWIAVENEEMETVGYFCSECDLPMETEQRTNYCPNCGAKMVEPQERSDKE